MPTSRPPISALWSAAVGAAVLGAACLPGFGNPLDDRFPLSTYPMFARDRGAVATVTTASTVDSTGRRKPVPPAMLGNAETMQALQTLKKTVRAGPAASLELCRAISRRIERDRNQAPADAHSVEIATSRVDTIAFLQDKAVPRQIRLHAKCNITPPAASPAQGDQR